MNTAKLVNSALTGGGLIYPENLNVIIGSESKGYPKGYVLDANATLSLAGQASSGSGSQTPGQQGGSGQQSKSPISSGDVDNSLIMSAGNNTATKNGAIALGINSRAENVSAIAIGRGARATGRQSFSSGASWYQFVINGQYQPGSKKYTVTVNANITLKYIPSFTSIYSFGQDVESSKYLCQIIKSEKISDNQFSIEVDKSINEKSVLENGTRFRFVLGCAIGDNCVSLGSSNVNGVGSFGSGFNNMINGKSSGSIGFGNIVEGDYSAAFGGLNKIKGDGSFAGGSYNNISGIDSATFGDFGIITADQSLVEGGYCQATNVKVHAEGNFTAGIGQSSHVEGGWQICALFLTGSNSTYEIVNFVENNNKLDIQYLKNIKNCVIRYYPTNNYNGYYDQKIVLITSIEESGSKLILKTSSPLEAQFPGQTSITNMRYVVPLATSIGIASHSENCSQSIGVLSHSEGFKTIAMNYAEHAEGMYNLPTQNDDVSKATIHTIGIGQAGNRMNSEETKRNGDKYILNIGGYNGKNSDSSKSLQKVISDIETAVSLNSNGPWDVDITSEFVNGNVTIKPLSMWSISQGVKRVYFTANLKQGDIITIPDTLRMYIGWKISDNRFGMADWTTAGKKYTVTTDSNYVILVATANDNPGVQTNNLPSFGKVMLRTSNPEFKPTAQTDAKKDHTNDDKVMRGIAHQGFHKLERANSLAAFRAAAKEGWRYVETDTYMTKDGKFIVSHDDNIPVGYTNGTTTLTDTSYKYEQHTLDEILAFHGPNGEKVDTLEDFCKLCKECGLHPYIEIKQGNMWQANTIDTTNAKYNGKPYAIKLLDIVNRYGLRGNATFISSTPYTLRLMAKQDQSYRYGIVYFGQLKITDTNLTTLISKIEEFNNDTDASKAYLFVDVNIDNLKTADANIVNLFVSRNCALEVWTAKTKEDLDNLDPYVTGVTSDNIHAGEILAKNI